MSQSYLSSQSQQRSSSQPSSSHVVPAISSHYDMYNETDSQRTVRDEELYNSSQGDSQFLDELQAEIKKVFDQQEMERERAARENPEADVDSKTKQTKFEEE